MSKINQIKQRLGRNSWLDRDAVGTVGYVDRGTYRRGRALKADHKRNIAKQFGYPDAITPRQHYDMAYRNGIGSNLAFGIVLDTWRVPPVIYDGPEDPERREKNPTEFEQAVDEHFDRLKVWDRLKGLDKAQRPMRYGGLMFVTKEKQGTKSTDELLRLPSIEYLADMRIYHEAQLQVEQAVQDAMRIDYGRPLMFQIKTNAAGSTNEWENQGPQVHASRVYAYGEGALDGSIYGVPCLESCFEALMDAAKTRGSASEGFYQNAANKYAVHLADNATEAEADAILGEMEDFDNEASRSMALGGGSISTIQTTMTADPTNPWTIAVNEACAAHSKPMKMVIGNQTGERASTEDITAWNRVIMDRQESVGNAMIKGLIDELIEKFTFPAPTDEITIAWRDLNESTAEQKADLAKKRVDTNKVAVDTGMQPIYSTEYIQTEAGAPIEEVIPLDELLEGEEDENDPSEEVAEE